MTETRAELGLLEREDELAILTSLLAAQEKTNKEIAQSLFVTVKTVEVYLSSVYRKLEISSRRQLATALSG